MKIHLFLFVTVLIAYISANDEWKCQKGVRYKENNCNYCECFDGEVECLNAYLCKRDKDYEEMVACSDYGKVTEVDCNTCVCTKEHGTVCTINKC